MTEKDVIGNSLVIAYLFNVNFTNTIPIPHYAKEIPLLSQILLQLIPSLPGFRISTRALIQFLLEWPGTFLYTYMSRWGYVHQLTHSFTPLTIQSELSKVSTFFTNNDSKVEKVGHLSRVEFQFTLIFQIEYLRSKLLLKSHSKFNEPKNSPSYF